MIYNPAKPNENYQDPIDYRTKKDEKLSLSELLSTLPEVNVDSLDEVFLETNEELKRKLDAIEKAGTITPQLLNTRFD